MVVFIVVIHFNSLHLPVITEYNRFQYVYAFQLSAPSSDHRI